MKLIKGNPGQAHGRKLPENEPQPVVHIPPIPGHLDAYAEEEWNRVCQVLFNVGILTDIDGAALGAYCQSYSRWRLAEETLASMAENDETTKGLLIRTTNGNAIQNPVVGIANKAAADMVRYAAEFGMTPSARSRLSIIGRPAGTDAAEAFFND